MRGSDIAESSLTCEKDAPPTVVPTVAAADDVAEAEDAEDTGPKILTKKEKEKLKKEREKVRHPRYFYICWFPI